MPQELMPQQPQRQAELLPELQPYLFMDIDPWPMLCHPRLVAMYHDVLVPQLNSSYQQMQQLYDEAVAERNVEAAVMMFTARPFRTEAFDSLYRLMDNQQYWSLLAKVWIDQENPEDYADEWRDRFAANIPGKHLMMNDDERKAFGALPTTVTVYRADISDETSREGSGLSWTTDPRVAKWFAGRFNSDHNIYRGEVAWSDIAAYWTRRSESEVLVPEKGKVKNIVQISAEHAMQIERQSTQANTQTEEVN